MEEIKVKSLLESKDDVSIGKILKFYRLNKHFSQRQLAKELGSNFQKISKYELGRHHLPYERLIKICGILNVRVIDFAETNLSLINGMEV